MEVNSNRDHLIIFPQVLSLMCFPDFLKESKWHSLYLKLSFSPAITYGTFILKALPVFSSLWASKKVCMYRKKIET